MFIRKCIKLSALICFSFLSSFAAATYDSIYWAPPLDVQGTKIVNAKGYVVQLKGFATMDPTGVTKAQIVHFKKDWNITILRMPLEVDGAGNCWRTSNIVVNAPYLAAADSVLKWCEENHIYVLFDGWHESARATPWAISARRSKPGALWPIGTKTRTISCGRYSMNPIT